MSTEMLTAVIAALSGGGGLAALVQWLSNRKKSGAEEVEIWTRASVSRIKAMHDQMESLESRIHILNTELDEQRAARRYSDDELRKYAEKYTRAVTALTQHGIPWDT